MKTIMCIIVVLVAVASAMPQGTFIPSEEELVEVAANPPQGWDVNHEEDPKATALMKAREAQDPEFDFLQNMMAQEDARKRPLAGTWKPHADGKKSKKKPSKPVGQCALGKCAKARRAWIKIYNLKREQNNQKKAWWNLHGPIGKFLPNPYATNADSFRDNSDSEYPAACWSNWKRWKGKCHGCVTKFGWCYTCNLVGSMVNCNRPINKGQKGPLQGEKEHVGGPEDRDYAEGAVMGREKKDSKE